MKQKKIPETIALKKEIASLSIDIIAKERKTMGLIKKELGLESRLVEVLAKMIKLEAGKIVTTEKMTKEKEERLQKRITNLQKKHETYEKRKEAAKQIKEKQQRIKQELEGLESKLKSETTELYGIKKITSKAPKAEFSKKPSGKKAKKTEKKPEQEKIAKVTEELRKALEEEKNEKEKETSEETFESPIVEESSEEKPETMEEEKEETKEALDWEKRQMQLIGKEPEKEEEEKQAPEEETEKPQEQNEEEPVLNSESLGSGDIEKIDIEESEENLADEKEAAETEGYREIGETPEKNTKIFKSGNIALSYPDWQENQEKTKETLVSVSNGQFSFELRKSDALGQTIKKFVSEKAEKIESKPGSKVLIQKETSNNIFMEYSEEKTGQKFLTKALFILHKRNAYSIIFSAPAEQFQKIDDLFLKTIFSVQTF